MKTTKESKLIKFTNKGIYCPTADIYIDPWKPVKRALITHGHSDHARPGMKSYLATKKAVPVIKHRLGSSIDIQGIEYNEPIKINGVDFSFHPAGHIIGSAQIRVSYKGEIWVISGDYKIENDGLTTPFEPIKCHHFVTESTFGIPAFNWKPQSEVINEINEWWSENKSKNSTSIISAYSLGKAQRLIHNIDHSIGQIYCHTAVQNVNEIIKSQGIDIKLTKSVNALKPKDSAGSLIIIPPGAITEKWLRQFKQVRTASASGWMAIRGTRRRSPVDRGFVLSDHADWNGLNDAVKNTGAENIYVTHGYTNIYSKYLSGLGFNAKIVETEYTGEQSDSANEKEAS